MREKHAIILFSWIYNQKHHQKNQKKMEYAIGMGIA